MNFLSTTTDIEVKATVGDGSDDERTINILFTGESLGRGVCGPVKEAVISETGEKVAVKAWSKYEVEQSEEVKYLKLLQHCNIVKLLYHFRITQPLCEMECILMERMGMSLRDLSSVPGRLRPFELKLIMYQLLRSVAFIHTQDICHRDIKPANVLINPQTCVLKLCDFGVACDLGKKDRNETWLGTLPYHAPELLLGYGNYTNSVDVWGIGCIFVELLKGIKQLFPRGRTYIEQIDIMMQLFGTPTEDQFRGMKPLFAFHTLRSISAEPWSKIISPHIASGDVVSLCSGLLCYSPSSRLPAHEALAHNYFDELRSPETTHLANGNPLPPLFNFQPGELPTPGKQNFNDESQLVTCCLVM